MKVQIPAKALRAAGHCMAVKDIRYYLNGVLLDVTGPTEAFVVGTDGHVLFAGRVDVEYLEGQQTAAYQIIIPAEIIKGLDKKAPWFILEALPDGRYMLGGKCFTAIAGIFPEYRRVIPHEGQLTGEPGQYNPALLAQCVSAVREFHGLKRDSNEWGMKQNGRRGVAVVFGGDASCVAVIMPMNGDGNRAHLHQYHGFMSPTQKFHAAA